MDISRRTLGFVVLATIGMAAAAASVPATLASEQIKWSDWLGFAGNIVGAGAALFAAAVAWRAVQRQIEAQRDSIAAQRDSTVFSLLSREEDRLLRELHGLNQCEQMYDDVIRALGKPFVPGSPDGKGAFADYHAAVIELGYGASFAIVEAKVKARLSGSLEPYQETRIVRMIRAVFIESEKYSRTETNGALHETTKRNWSRSLMMAGAYRDNVREEISRLSEKRQLYRGIIQRQFPTREDT
jgi:hypothetical protein